MYAVNVLT